MARQTRASNDLLRRLRGRLTTLQRMGNRVLPVTFDLHGLWLWSGFLALSG